MPRRGENLMDEDDDIVIENLDNDARNRSVIIENPQEINDAGRERVENPEPNPNVDQNRREPEANQNEARNENQNEARNENQNEVRNENQNEVRNENQNQNGDQAQQEQEQRNRDEFNRQQDQRRRESEANLLNQQAQQNRQNQQAQQNRQNQQAQQEQEARQQREREVQLGKKKPKKAKKQEVSYRGTVNAQEGLDDKFLSEQAGQIRAMRYLTREVTFGARRGFSSPEFRRIKQDLHRLDSFMRTINGRTSLNPEEMAEYERLTLKVHSSTAHYLKKKKADIEKRKGADGKVKISAYEKKRIRAIRDIQQEIGKLRADMYEKDLQKHKESMQKTCTDKINDLKDTLNDIYVAGAKNDAMKPVLEESVTRTLFYLNRMDSLNNTFRMKPGMTFKKAKESMNRNLEPTKQELELIAKHQLTTDIVNAGMKAVKEGKEFSTDDIARLQKQYIQKNARTLAEQRRRRENLRGLQRQQTAGPQQQAPQQQAPQQQAAQPGAAQREAAQQLAGRMTQVRRQPAQPRNAQLGRRSF